MDIIRQKSMGYMNSVKPPTQQSNPLPIKNNGSSSINPVATFITALPGIAALILVLMRTSSTAATLSNGGFTTGLNGSLYTSANVGVGTNNPAGKLQVVGNAYITTGNLGVGTISTPSKLTVLETGAVNAYVTTIRGTNALNDGLLIDLLDDTGNSDLLRMRSNTSSKFAVLSDGSVEIGNSLQDGELMLYGGLIIDANSSSNSSMLIDARGSSGSGMFLTSSGKLIVGTVSQAALSTTLSAPYKMQIFGDVNFVGNLFQNGESFGAGGDGAGSNLVVVSEYLPNLTVGGTLTVETEIRSNNFLTVVKDTMIGGNLTVMEEARLNSNLVVQGKGTFTDLFVSKDIFFNGNIYQDGELFGGNNTGTTTGVTKYSDVNTIVLAATDTDWISDGSIYQEGRMISTSSMGAYLEKTFLITREGTYILNVNYLLGPDFGIATLSIDDLALTVNSEPQITDIDLYTPYGSTNPTMMISYTVSLNAANHRIKIENKGATALKNPLSGGYRVGLGDSSLVYIPVAKSPTQVETRITINKLAPDDRNGWSSVNSNSTSLTNGLILTTGAQGDGFYRDITISVEGGYLMNFVLPLDPSYGKLFIELEGPAGLDSVNVPLDTVDLYTAVGGAGSSRIIKSYSKTLSVGTYRLRCTSDGTKNNSSVGYTIGVGEINFILINAGLSSFGTVIFSTLNGDIIENDADGWIGANSLGKDKGGFSRYATSTGFVNYLTDTPTYDNFSNETTDFLNMKIMNNTEQTVYIAYVETTTGYLFVKKLVNDAPSSYIWSPLGDQAEDPLIAPRDHLITTVSETQILNYSTQYVSLAVRKIGSIEYIYVAFIQQQDIYSQVDPDNINTQAALDSKVRVKRYNATTSRWDFVSTIPGSYSVSEGPAAHLSLQIDSDGNPVIAYSNLESYDGIRSNANKLVVQRWSRTGVDVLPGQWSYVIDEGLVPNTRNKNGVTPGGAYFISMALSERTDPNYVATGTTTQRTSTTSFNSTTVVNGQEITLSLTTAINDLYPVGCKVKVLSNSILTPGKYFYFTVTDKITNTLTGTVFDTNLGTTSTNSWTVDYIGKTTIKNRIYAAFADGSLRDSPETQDVVNGLSVYTYELNTVTSKYRWKYLGPLASQGAVDFINLMVFNNTVKGRDELYIGYEDLFVNAGSAVKFKHIDLTLDPPITSESWEYVGEQGFTQGPVHNLVMDGKWNSIVGEPELYVGFRDGRDDPLGRNYDSRMSIMYHDGTTGDIWDYALPALDVSTYAATSTTELDLTTFTSTCETSINLSTQTSGSTLTITITKNLSFSSEDRVVILRSIESPSQYIQISVDEYVFDTGVLIGKVMAFSGVSTFNKWNVSMYRYRVVSFSISSIDMTIPSIGGTVIFNVGGYTGTIEPGDIARIISSTTPTDYIDLRITDVSSSQLTATVLNKSGTATYNNWNVNVYKAMQVSMSFAKENIFIKTQVGKPYLTGDSIRLSTPSRPIIDGFVESYTDDIMKILVETKNLITGTANNVITASYDISIVARGSIDGRHFTEGPVAETAMAVRFGGSVEIFAIYRQGEPIVYHGSYITIFDEIADVPSIYPQTEGKIGYGLEYEYFFPYTTTYKISVEYVLGREFGVSRLRLNGIIIGDPIDCFLGDLNPKIWTRTITYTVTLFAGSNIIRLENAGTKNVLSEGFNIGVASVKIEYFTVTRNGDMDNLTVTGNTALNSLTVNSLSVAKFTGIETITIGNQVNSLILLGNAVKPGVMTEGIASTAINFSTLSVNNVISIANVSVASPYVAGDLLVVTSQLSTANFFEVYVQNYDTGTNTITGLLTFVQGVGEYTSWELTENNSDPMGTVMLSTTAPNLTFTNYLPTGGVDFKLTTLTNSGLSTGTVMKLNRYGKFGVGLDTDIVDVAFGAKGNVFGVDTATISDSSQYKGLSILENTNAEGNGLYIKTASGFRNRYPLYIQTGASTANTFIFTSDGFLGVGVPASQMNARLTVGGNAVIRGGYMTLGSQQPDDTSEIIMSNDARIVATTNSLRIRSLSSSISASSSITLQTDPSSTVVINSETISARHLSMVSKNTAKAWLHITNPSNPAITEARIHYNIEAISRIRPGVYSVRMTTPIEHSKYAVVATSDATNGNLNTMVNISSDYIFVVVVRNSAGSERDPGAFSVVVYGV